MINIELPILAERALTLPPDDEAVRGDPNLDPTPLDGRVLLGGPLAVPITAAYAATDADLAAFITAGEAQYTFHLVHTTITFESKPGDPEFESSRVALWLAGGATVLSMKPQRVTSETEQSTTWALGPELTIFDVGVSLGSYERTRAFADEEDFLVASRGQRNDPHWEFTRTTARGLTGQHPLVMVVRTPREQALTATITVTAAVRSRKLLRYKRHELEPLVLATAFA